MFVDSFFMSEYSDGDSGMYTQKLIKKAIVSMRLM